MKNSLEILGVIALLAVQTFAQPLSDYDWYVVSPNGGETYAVGDTLATEVNSYNPASLCQLYVDIGLAGFPMPGISTQFRPSVDTVHSFVIPPFLITTVNTGSGPRLDSTSTVSDECLIRLADYSLPAEYDVSDSTFSIIAAPIVITHSPEGMVNVGDSLTVDWRAADRIGGCIIELSVDNGQTWSTLTKAIITRSSSSWGSFRFVVPENADSAIACKVRISSDDDSFSAVSSTIFSVGVIRVRYGSATQYHCHGLNWISTAHGLVVNIPLNQRYELVVADLHGKTLFKKTGQGDLQALISSNILAPGRYIIHLEADGYFFHQAFIWQ